MRVAGALFAESGYRNVSVEEIGSALGLTGPAVYRHFGSKYDILVQALDYQVGLVDELTAQTDAEGTDPAEQLALFCDRLGELTTHEGLSTLWRREQRHLRPSDLDRMRDHFAHYADHIAAKIAGSREDISDEDAALLGFATLSLYSNTSELRGSLPTARLLRLQRAVAEAILTCELSDAAEVPCPPPVPRRPASRRERIIDAATALFAEHGFHDVHIGDIAHQADVSIATLYQHVSGKAELLRLILWRGLHGTLFATAEALADTDDDEAAFEALIRLHVRLSLGVHSRTTRILMRDIVYLPEPDQVALRVAHRDYVAEWTAGIRAGLPNLTEADAGALTRAVFGVVADVISSPLRARPTIAADLVSLCQAMTAPSGVSEGR